MEHVHNANVQMNSWKEYATDFAEASRTINAIASARIGEFVAKHVVDQMILVRTLASIMTAGLVSPNEIARRSAQEWVEEMERMMEEEYGEVCRIPNTYRKI